MFTEPAFNFDDFHDNIVSTEPATSTYPLLQTEAPAPITEVSTLSFVEHRKTASHTTIPAPSRKISGSDNLLSRKNSTASSGGRSYLAKSDSITSIANAASLFRARRQSHFPPNAFNNAPPSAPAAAPRKSLGPGALIPTEPQEVELTRRRPSQRGGRKPSNESQRSGRLSRIQPTDSVEQLREAAKESRTSKVKSMLVPRRQASKDLLTPSRTPEPSKQTAAQTTPGKSVTPGATTNGDKRRSIMPGHATGLGARTVSPTDARRMKRMSMLPNAPPVPNRRISQAPPTPQPEPPTLQPTTAVPPHTNPPPRKSMTPSSSRTTPDPNRKSHGSANSLPSSTNHGAGRHPPHTLYRQSQNSSTSRLSTPKPRTDGNETDERPGYIPPVPAIPKSYESPASEVDQPFFSARSSSLHMIDTPTDSPNLTSFADAIMALELPRSPTAFLTLPGALDQAQQLDRPHADTQKHSIRRSQQILRLPPINLPPLSTPTATKIKSFKETRSDAAGPPSTPPGLRGFKTPSTPMTASRATFFARKLEEQQNAMRSSTSHHALRGEAGTVESFGLNLPPFAFEADSVSARTMSPFVSSSLPKDSNEFESFMRPPVDTEPKRNGTQPKPNGPRAPSYSFCKTESSTPVTDKSSNSTPSSTAISAAHNVQRQRSQPKLSASLTTSSGSVRYDNMPPPKIPASSTWTSLASKSSASPTQKSGFFRSRRKMSASSNNTLQVLDSHESGSSMVTRFDITRPSLESIHALSATHSSSGALVSSDSGPASKTTSAPHDSALDKDDLVAEDEMRKLASKRRDLEAAAKKLDALQARAKPTKRTSPSTALQTPSLNIFERGEIVDYPDVYFTGTPSAQKIVGDLSSTSTNFGYDDERGDYNIVEGDHLVYRYEVVDMLGKGSFGQVVRCVDHKHGRLVAVKIIRNKKRFHQQALVEVDILQKLREWDPLKKHHVVNFDQSFYFRGHLCISTDLLDMNLYEFIKVHDFRGFSLKLIRRFTKQMLSSLVLLHGKKVIHCDLKPENVLLAHPAHSEIKVIDFGSSCFEHEKVYTYIQSRFYRSPEVILGMSYGMPIDMWSLGCILAELYTGYPIFPGENEQEQLACIMEVFGPPEKHLIEKSTRKKLFFDSMGKPRLTVSSKGKRRRPSSKDLRSVLKCDDDPFLDFIARCLRWDPVRRLTPQDALRHEFITGVKATVPSSSRRHVISSMHNSPMKRSNTSTVVSGGGTRPLPPPPAGTLKPLVMSIAGAATSPSKGSARRQSSAVNSSGTHHSQSTLIANTKRISHAAANGAMSGTGVTRVTIHKVGSTTGGARTDIAAAAAAASLNKL